MAAFTMDNFYKSKEWALFRLSVMQDRLTDDGEIICAHCGKPIVRQYDCIAHHKEALTETNVNDVMVSLNPDNIDLVHHICHNRIHDKLGYKVRQVYLVYGSPLSGKSTWVENVRCEGDLIVDMDSIWQCVSGCDRYVKPARLSSVAFGVRDALMDMVKYRRGKWNNAYVIGGYPLSGERERLLRTLGAREVFIDTKKDECLNRLMACGDGRNINEWVKYIDDWWEKYSGRSAVPPTLK